MPCTDCKHYRGNSLPQQYLRGWDAWHCPEIPISVEVYGDATAQLVIDEPETFQCSSWAVKRPMSRAEEG